MVEFYILRSKKRSGGKGAGTVTLLDIPFIAEPNSKLTIIHGLDSEGRIQVPGKSRKNLDTIRVTAKKYKVPHRDLAASGLWANVLRRVELTGQSEWQIRVKNTRNFGPSRHGPQLLEPAKSSFKKYAARHSIGGLQGKPVVEALIESPSKVGEKDTELALPHSPLVASSSLEEAESSSEVSEDFDGMSSDSALKAPGNTKADLKASMDNPLTRLATLQAELKDSQRVLAQLEEAGTALQAGADEYNRLIGELRERKDRHSALKVQSRDLKKVKRQYQAKERALRELLEL